MLFAAVASIGLTAGNTISGVQATDSMEAVADSTERVDSLNTGTAEVVYTEKSADREELANQLISTVGNNLVALVAIVIIFGSPVVIVLIIFNYRHRQKKAQYELIAKAIEAGKDIPDGLFQVNKREPRNNLTVGVTNLFIGIGISILLWNLIALRFASIGVLVSCVGIGQIIIYLAMNKPKKAAKESDPSENKRMTE